MVDLAASPNQRGADGVQGAGEGPRCRRAPPRGAIARRPVSRASGISRASMCRMLRPGQGEHQPSGARLLLDPARRPRSAAAPGLATAARAPTGPGSAGRGAWPGRRCRRGARRIDSERSDVASAAVEPPASPGSARRTGSGRRPLPAGPAASRCATARSSWAPASRWDPSRAAVSAARTAWASTVGESPARSAWWAMRASWWPDRTSAASTTSACSWRRRTADRLDEDGLAGELVPVRREPRPDLEEAGALALLERVVAGAADGGEQVELDPVRAPRPPPPGPSAPRWSSCADPAEHGVADGGRHLVRRAGEHLGHEERVAAGGRVDLRRDRGRGRRRAP